MDIFIKKKVVVHNWHIFLVKEENLNLLVYIFPLVLRPPYYVFLEFPRVHDIWDILVHCHYCHDPLLFHLICLTVLRKLRFASHTDARKHCGPLWLQMMRRCGQVLSRVMRRGRLSLDAICQAKSKTYSCTRTYIPLQVYSLLCVISQYQEYRAGRGTANSGACLGRKVITVILTVGVWWMFTHENIYDLDRWWQGKSQIRWSCTIKDVFSLKIH